MKAYKQNKTVFGVLTSFIHIFMVYCKKIILLIHILKKGCSHGLEFNDRIL